jgi:predicted peroxiredoxin
LIEKGESIDTAKLIHKEEFEKVKNAISQIEFDGIIIKPVYYYMEQKLEYGKIRIAISMLKQSNTSMTNFSEKKL